MTKEPAHISLVVVAPGLPHATPGASLVTRDLDEAFKYIEEATASTSVLPGETINLRHLRRKIDFHIIPIMTACFTMQYLDKVVYNYAAVMGMPKDLKLKGNEYSNVATAFFGAYLGAELLNRKISSLLAAESLRRNQLLHCRSSHRQSGCLQML